MRAYVGERTNRRHRPGRAFERTGYRFDVVSDYGAFRDLQRHRMLTIEWQQLGPALGYEMPDIVGRGGPRPIAIDASMARSAELYEVMARVCPAQAPYAVALAFRIRYVMQMNAREAMHLSSCARASRATRPTASSRRRCTGSSPSTPGTGSSPRP